MVHVFVIIIILKGLNLMILANLLVKGKKIKNQNNIKIPNEGLFYLTP
jgi:hypothetical protein